MKAYSIDLRQKIIDVYNQGQVSQRQLAKRFCVAKSFIQKLLKQYRETGKIDPKPHGGGKKLTATPEEMALLKEIIEKHSDATLVELCQIFQAQTGMNLSRATMGRMTQRLNFTLKKNNTCLRKRN